MSGVSRVIKLQDDETVRFVELYADERLLYDTTCKDYKDRGLRLAAAKRISEKMNINNFGPKEVITKFKNLRSSYCQELKKISKSLRSGVGSDDVYVPKVRWFNTMDSFIHPFVQQRQTKSNFVLPKTSKFEIEETSDDEINAEDSEENPDSEDNSSTGHRETPSPSQKRKRSETCPAKLPKADKDSKVIGMLTTRKEILDEMSCSSEVDPLSEENISTNHQETPLTSQWRKESETCSANWPKTDNDNAVAGLLSAIQKLDDISSRSVQIHKDDSYDCFGKYVSSMLRTIGPPAAMKLQQQITTLITEAMCPPSPGQPNLNVPSETLSQKKLVGKYPRRAM